MSFLAQLQKQQQPSTTEQSLQLFYRLSLKETKRNQSSHLAQLKLDLVVGEKGALADAKPYQPQSSHLQLPPPFVGESDKPVLQQLLNTTAENGWPEYDLDEPNHFLHQLFATSRVYFYRGDRLEPIALQGQQNIALTWQTQTNGHQRFVPSFSREIGSGEISARKSEGWQLCQSADAFHVLALNNPTRSTAKQSLQLQVCQLTVNQKPITLEQQTLIKERLDANNYQLAAEDIGHFITTFGTLWTAAKLPSPNHIEAIPLSTQVRATMTCTQVNQKDVITLGYAYLNKDYCTWFEDTGFKENNHLPHYVVLNDQLHIVERKLAVEKPFQTLIKKALKGFEHTAQGYTVEDNKVDRNIPTNQWQHFFTQQKRRLDKEGVIFRIGQRFTQHYIQAETWLSQLNKRDDGVIQVDLFVESDNEKINLLALLDQIQQYNLQHGYGAHGEENITLNLEDGRLLLLPADQVIRLSEEFGDMLIAGRSSLDFHPSQASRLKQLEDILPGECDWQGDTRYLEISRRLTKVPDVIDQTTCNITATLRPYQWLGVCWIQHLKNCGVNGLLADDMGLGKTLQTIAHLSLEFSKDKPLKPALVVVPTSLLHNWQNEVKKFAPHLRVLIYHGPQRKKKLQTSDHHILLTSYQLIVNDADYFESTEFSWMILDEAQNIKNPRTKSHVAVKSVQADHKLCLSGTPVENNLIELWSILNFLMPQCLGSLNEFKFHFQKPIENEGNVNKLNQLLQRIEPFMLRRTKQAVAQDLPEKTEILQTIDLGEAQTSFYESIKQDTWQSLQQQLEGSENQGEQQLFVLSALMKLRQVCCDPTLLGEEDIPSAKRQHCIDMAIELASEGRAILIFSQFTSMLDILAEDLKKQGIQYGLLTGQTKNRQALVDKFQAGEFPVFLISLKAGGVGLNLTRADTVIHYDPWWNSAAEQQATDRAHRIGQKNAVFVYKLIAENTIEEKIAALQARKAELGQTINLQAQQTGAKFSLKLEELLNLWVEEK